MDKKKIMLLTGLVFGSSVGFVLGWLWGDRPNYLSNIRVLDVLIAIGTIGAAIGAAYASRVALKISRDEEVRRLDERRRYIYAQEYMLWHWGARAQSALKELLCKLEKLKFELEKWSAEDDAIVQKELQHLSITTIPVALDRIHDVDDFGEWAFIVSSAGVLQAQLGDRFKDYRRLEDLDFSDFELEARVRELHRLLKENVKLVIWEFDRAS